MSNRGSPQGSKYSFYFIIFIILLNLGCNNNNANVSEKQNEVKEQQVRKKMIAVIFEVQPAEGAKEEYLEIAKSLRPQLDSIDGFVSIERFESLNTPGKILSLSFWRDEKALERWRNLETHRAAQKKGRQSVFKDYRLRVANVIRDYGMFERNEAPTDSKEFHDEH